MSTPPSFLLKDPSSFSLRRKLILVCLLILPITAVIAYNYWGKRVSPAGSGKMVDWGVYRQFDMTTSRLTPELQALDGQKVRSPGFMVPLEDSRAEVTEFLLVPSPQACIHAPPPPANQMIYVRMVGSPAKTSYGPVVVEGTLRVTSQTHQYGTASFQIYGENVEAYKGE